MGLARRPSLVAMGSHVGQSRSVGPYRYPARPFVIHVIDEGGAKVVANVLVDRLVEGRHCLKVPAGWKCPDFG
jgi:hypothetical protein